MQNANGGEPNLYANVDVIPMIGMNGLWSQKKRPTDNFRPKEDPTTLTTHPAKSHNIRLTKNEDVRDCIKNNCLCTRLLAKNPCMYATFGQNPAYTEKAVVKNRPRVKPIKGTVNG